MVYKKYIKRGGKTFGPYIYHSRKVNGRVTSEYLGKSEEKTSKKNLWIFLSAGIVLLLIFSFLILNYIPFKSFTGFAISENITKQENTPNILSDSSVITTKNILSSSLAGCGELSTANSVYTLNVSVNSTGTCFNITAFNVTLDCAGYTINYSSAGTLGYGIFSNQSYTNISNCNIIEGNSLTNSKIGIYFYVTNNGTINNNNVTIIGGSTSFGIYLYAALKNTLTSNTVATNSSTGIYLNNLASRNTLNNNIGKSNWSIGIALFQSSNNTLTSNKGLSNSTFGIIIQSHSDNNTLFNNTGIGYNASVGLELHTSSNNNLTSNTGISNLSTGLFLFVSNNSILTNNIGMSNSSQAIRIQTSSYNNLTNNTGVSNSANGILLLVSSNNNLLINNTGISNQSSYGIQVQLSSANNTLIDNTGIGNTSGGIYIFSDAENNTLTNNFGISNASFGINVDHSNNNNLTSNTGLSDINAGVYVYFSNYTSFTNNTGISNTSVGTFFSVPWSSILTSNTGMSNSSAGFFSTGAQNTSFINNTGITNSSALGGFRMNFSNYDTFINNTGIGYTGAGIFFYSSNYNNITSNLGISNSSRGITIDTFSSWNNIINNTGTSQVDAGIHISRSLYCNFTNNIGMSNGTFGIRLQQSGNNILINNSGESLTGVGIYLEISSSNNTLNNNTGTSNTSQGIRINTDSTSNNLTLNTGTSNTSQGILCGTPYNNLTSNTGTSITNVGLYISNCSNCNLTNNIGISNISAGLRVDLSNNTILINNTGISNTQYGIYLLTSSNNNLTSNTGISNNTGIRLETNSNNNLLVNNLGVGNVTSGIYIQTSSNNTLNSNIGIGNISVGIYLFTSANNNLLINNTGISNSSYGILLQSGASNNNLTSNLGVSISVMGIYIWTAANNNTLTNNIGTSDIQNAIRIYQSSNDTLINNTGISNSSYGIYLFTSSNDLLINNTGVSNISQGIRLENSSNNNLINNLGISNSSIGIYFYQSSNNSLINNIGRTNISQGIRIESSPNNTLTSNTGISESGAGFQLISNDSVLINNTGKSSSSVGIQILSSWNNTLISNTGMSNGFYGIYLLSYSNNNTLISSVGTSNSSYGIYLVSSNNNYLEKSRAEGYLVNSYGIAFRSSNNTYLKNCLNISGFSGDIFYLTNNISVNNTFLNCSYRTTGANETVFAGGSLIRKWWYLANATDLKSIPVTANIIATNSTGSQEFSTYTNSSGLTNLTEITDYVNNGTSIIYSSNYTISATSSSYINIVSHTFNASLGNNYNDIFLFGNATPPNINFTFPTPANATTQNVNSVYVNVSTSDASEHSAFIDWNKTLAGWWNFESVNSSGFVFDNSSYGHNGQMFGFNSNTTVVGKRGKALDFDGINESVNLGIVLSNVSPQWTYSVWFYPRSNGTSISNLVGQGNNPEIRWGGALNRLYLFIGWSQAPGYKQLSSSDVTLNQWHYAVGVVNLSDSSNQSASLYVDGVLVNYDSWNTGTIVRPSTTHVINIRDSARSFNGTIDEVMIFSRALTPSEINASYNAGLYQLYSNFQNLSDGTYIYKAYAIDSTGTVNSTENRTITIDTVPPDINFTFPTPANATTQSSTSVYINVSTNDTNEYSTFIDWNRSLVGWWNFESVNSSGFVFDNSSYGHNGQMFGFNSNTTVVGKRGKALDFDGIAGKYVDINTTDSLRNITGELTVSAWVYPKQAPTGLGRIVINNFYSASNSSNTRGWSFGRNFASDDNFYFQLFNSSGNLSSIGKSNFFSDNLNEWTYIVGVFKPSNYVRLYVNGVLVGESNSSTASLSIIPEIAYNNSMPLRIGARADFSPQGMWNGTIDEVMIFNRALSPQEINASYQAGSYRLYNNFTNLIDGTYNYKAYAINSLGTINSTEERTVTINTAAVPSGTPSTGGASVSGGATGKVECTNNNDCSSDKICLNYKCVKLFDVQILDFKSPVELGNFFDFTYLIKSMANLNDDVQINFRIVSQDGTIVSNGSDTIYFGNSEQKTESSKIFLPTTINSGIYTFYVEVVHKDYKASSYRTIEISVKGNTATIKFYENMNIIIYVAIGIALLSIIILFLILHKRKIKKKKKISPTIKKERKTSLVKHIPHRKEGEQVKIMNSVFNLKKRRERLEKRQRERMLKEKKKENRRKSR